jgi:hypothetical protein
MAGWLLTDGNLLRALNMSRATRLIMVAFVLLSGTFINVHGKICGYSLNSMHWGHGWPLTWLGRDYYVNLGNRLAVIEVIGCGPLGLHQQCWPWSLLPGQAYRFSVLGLALDLAALGMLCVGTWFAFPATTSDRGRWQFGLRTLLAVQALVCLIACLLVNYPDPVGNLAGFGVFLAIVFTVISFGRAVCKIISLVRPRLKTDRTAGSGPASDDLRRGREDG